MNTFLRYVTNPIIKWVFGAAIVVLLISSTLNWKNQTDKNYDKWKTTSATQLANIQVLERKGIILDSIANIAMVSADSLRKEQVVIKVKLAKQVKTTRQLAKTADSLLNEHKDELPLIAITIISTKDSVITSLNIENTLLDSSRTLAVQESDSLRSVVSVKDNRIDNLKEQGDSLRTIIKSVPKPKKERFLGFIPLPSRKVVGIVSSVLTATLLLVKPL
jgi:hypothetical protein